MNRHVFFLFFCLLFAACLVEKEDELTQRSSLAEVQNNLASQSCDQCHSYPPTSGQHLQHTYLSDADKYPVGPVTCAACHAGSILTQKYVDWFGDSIPLPIVSHFAPGLPPDWDSVQAELRLWFGPEGAGGKLPPLLTGEKHMNGRIDVNFPREVRGPHNGKYSPKSRRCGVCHGPDKEKRWN